MPKSAVAKVCEIKPSKVVDELPQGASGWAPPGASMVVSSPREIDELMAQVPQGKLISLAELRAALARRYGTTIACPMTTGLFANIAARAAEERRQSGEPAASLTPWWRTLRAKGLLNEKYPGGSTNHRHYLEAEGHSVVGKGKTFRVEKWENQRFDLVSYIDRSLGQG